MKKIWVIGRQGMLAQSLLQELEKRGLPYISTSKGEVDIASKQALFFFAAKNPESLIINCAAYTAVDLAEKEKEKAYQLNVLGVENLIAVAKECGSKLFHISSDYVFDGEKKVPYTEEDLACPLAVYGQTKLEGERLIQQSGIDYVILRLSWLFGQGQNHFVAKILKKMKEEKELSVVHDQRGRMTASQDAASVIVDLLSQNGVFHFANSGETSWYEIALFIFEEAKKLHIPILCETIHPVATGVYPALAKRPLYSTLDTNKVEKLLGRRFPSWKEAVHQYLQKETENG